MRIQKQTISKRKLVILLSSLILLAAISIYFYFSMTSPGSEADRTQTDTTQPDPNQPKDVQNNPENKEEAPNTDHPIVPDDTAGSSKKQVQMVASVDQSNGTLYIRGGINYPVSEGSCYVQLSGPSGQSIRKDSTILQNPGSTDCKTISIPVSELAPGKWVFVLHYASDNYEGSSGEIPFTI